MPGPFRKRIYSIKSFRRALLEAFDRLDAFKLAHRRGLVDRAFAERIMLAVTQVNGCRYCQYGHARAALRAGVSQEEIDRLAAGEFDEAPPAQRQALLFAQHWAESEGMPAPEAWQALVATHGPETAADIIAHIRMITIGNLSGNTFDAFLSRLRGAAAPGSAIWQELGIFVLAPIFVVEGTARRFLRREHEPEPAAPALEGHQ
jgi:AhpD family alkylhydroperoxidase